MRRILDWIEMNSSGCNIRSRKGTLKQCLAAGLKRNKLLVSWHARVTYTNGKGRARSGF